MKKEKFITTIILAVLAVCVFVFSGCGSQDDISEQDVYVMLRMTEMETNSDCLTCLGCARQVSQCGFSGTYTGCIDCFGLTVGDDTDAEDMFWEAKIFSGICGTSCYGCYCVNFPTTNYKGDIVPVYGCMSEGCNP